MKKLEWYAFIHDFNSKNLIRINVLSKEEIKTMLKRNEISNYNEFRKAIRGLLMSRYWSKAEYEVLVTDLFPRKDDIHKIDVWYQLEPNLDRICEYICKEMELDF